jgi:hypothetical protein
MISAYRAAEAPVTRHGQSTVLQCIFTDTLTTSTAYSASCLRAQRGIEMTDAVVDKTKTATITVNTRAHSWSEREITFEQVVELAFPGQPYDPAGTTVEYSRGHGPDHALRPGKSVKVKDGMVFDVEPANRS